MSRIKMKKLIAIFIWLFLTIPVYSKPVVKLETSFGDIVIELDEANAPITVDNFLMYVKSDFYDGLIFHRVIKDFVIQGGGFDADLNQPDPCDPIINESNNGLSNLRGTVAMARQTEPDSATSQFFINVVDNNSGLNNLDWRDSNNVGYCVFGRVISDMNIVDRIALLPTEDYVPPNDMNDVPRPSGPAIIYNAVILGDLDNDNGVDFNDIAILSEQWLDSNNSDLLKITASDSNAGDWLGYAVAVDYNFAIIGTPKVSNNTGCAYIFKYDDGVWTQQAKLIASDGTAGDYFGGSVSISANHAIVGAHGVDSNSGAAYIFVCDDANWTQQKKLTGYHIEDWFGCSVSISGDCAIVGAKFSDVSAIDDGAAFIFYRNEGGTNNWGLIGGTGLSPSGAASNDNFGYSVSINGEYAIIGAIGYNPGGTNYYTGAAYVYMYNGTYWTKKAKLTASDGAKSDKFGRSVSTDGYYAIVGAYWDDDGGADSGSAYIFERNILDPNDWNQEAKLTASDAAAGDYFGSSVAIGEGYAIVGAYQNDDNGSNSGSAYIFAPDEINPDNWEQKTKLTAPDAAAGDYFGTAVAIGIGRRAVIGAYGNDDSGSSSGSAYIFNLCPDADLNGDCSVNLFDLAVLANNWLLQ
jgi:cyclophilin family peptidyl-prolyl cis-trans isomerase